MKKGQGISLNVIIIAAIALIVLVVLVAIFTGRLGGFQRELGEVTDTELFRVQALSSSKCVPNKQGLSNIKAGLVDLSELQAKSQYDLQVQSLIDTCANSVLSTSTEQANKDRCNNFAFCVWK
ncbi:hypothetical protein KY328_00435 [Candidatus Woesearchaeota archaeon]|nr:hypothetical protein [Candidatus Woesearchaeota archaeon]MBW3021363.1 hypothetical protein [Candidatus Woesearchaeota archaeon]